MARDILAAAHLSVDSALFINRLMGIDSLPPVLALMNNVYYPDDQARVDDLTVAVLIEAGLIDTNGVVDPTLASWMRVLERPDIEVTLRGMQGDRMRRAVVARQGESHVMALRRNDELVVQAVWSTTHSLDDVVSTPIWSAMRESADVLAPPPAEFESVTMPLQQVAELSAASTPGDMVRALRGELGLDMTTAKILNEVSAYSGQRCEIVMRENRGIQTVDTAAGVFVADTSYGRVLSAVGRQGSRLWVTFGPGTYARFRAAMSDLVQLTPSRDWFAAQVLRG
ncbi:ESX secretion-associated protein EspG [Mycobacterium simiae]|uniref:ESX secretion-associated protein EspG n=1 Tax=Mycobacterium simiae TaxID=1784 RepID=A0A5B1BPX3_MYCSI|nr:ESX secretion-associated protein EspG [Mycobacterium simiae]KAA1249875.1 ESX secretion-associated protein EspG [Mycobacterium simiae]